MRCEFEVPSTSLSPPMRGDREEVLESRPEESELKDERLADAMRTGNVKLSVGLFRKERREGKGGDIEG